MKVLYIYNFTLHRNRDCITNIPCKYLFMFPLAETVYVLAGNLVNGSGEMLQKCRRVIVVWSFVHKWYMIYIERTYIYIYYLARSLRQL